MFVSACSCAACVYLVVSAVALPAIIALQQVGAGATSFGHLVLPYGLLGENVPQLFQLIAGHLLHENKNVMKWSSGTKKSGRKVNLGTRKEVHSCCMCCCRVLYLSRHGGNAPQVNISCEDVSAKPGVLRVLQVADAAADSVFIFHIHGLCLLVDMCDCAVKVDLIVARIKMCILFFGNISVKPTTEAHNELH